jgi:isopentenyl phosphate kinase
MQPLTVIKLGGALLTEKRQPFTLRPSVLAQVAGEVRACQEAGLIQRLVLVHGVGSFGHPPVLAHQLHKGFQSPAQLIHLSDTQNRVMHLRMAVAEAFHAAGVAVSTLLPSSCMGASGANLHSSYLEGVRGFLGLGMVPLLGGDMLVDDQMGFCVFSGDKIAVELALALGASRLILATEVAGVYDRDPLRFPEARLIPRLQLSQEAESGPELDSLAQVDASQAMMGKLQALHPAHPAMHEGRLTVHILSMTQPGNLRTLLKGEKPVGTQVLA